MMRYELCIIIIIIIIIISYTEDMVELMERHRVHNHLFADDKQLPAVSLSTSYQSSGLGSPCIALWCASRLL